MTVSPQKVLADKVVADNDWDNNSTFAAREVAELIDQIVKSIVFTTRNGAIVSTDMITHVWFEVADNLRYKVPVAPDDEEQDAIDALNSLTACEYGSHV